MNDWLDNFSFSGIKLTEGEKSLMRFAMSKERKRIIKLLEGFAIGECDEYCSFRCECYGKYEAQEFIKLIKGEQK